MIRRPAFCNLCQGVGWNGRQHNGGPCSIGRIRLIRIRNTAAIPPFKPHDGTVT
jgi:hypothetical protein